ncbi:MAG: c-type cytochrome [Verrucomicrobiaceae bacterium]|nr:c-type cytochrome [Verrucomicrobiaceae bacterium]
MKTSLPSLLTALLAASTATAQLPTGADIGFSPGSVAGSAHITITDPGDHVWRLQYSTDLINWTNLETLKVHNGHLTRAYTPAAGTTRLFYRTEYNATLQSSLSSTTSTALVLPTTPYDYDNTVLPPAFAVNPILGQDNMPVTNVTTDAGAKLGRILFYDKRLSLNHTVSCSSCHQQQHGFSDPRRFSVGFEGGLTGRNSMGLSNARWYQRRSFFWDERSATLEEQVLQPIQNAVEMGMTLPALEARLGAEPFYTDLFNQVFGSPGVTSDRISRALAQFVRSIISVQSKYDAARAANFAISANWTTQEEQGRQLFNAPGNCSACHGTDNFVPGPNIFNNGLEFPYVDLGRGAITGVATDNGKFKVPSLRNIELTAPYMHDGRFATLEQVVDFYSNQVVDNPNLSPPLRLPPPGGVRRPHFTAAQKASLVAFMKSLSDSAIATNPKFSDPFNYGD